MAAGLLPAVCRAQAVSSTNGQTGHKLLFIGVGLAVLVIVLAVAAWVYRSRGRASHPLGSHAYGPSGEDPLTGLKAGGSMLAKLSQSLTTGQRYKLPFAVFVIELANHASLLKAHGREAADLALATAASRIRDVAEPADTVARVGDRHFAVLMEGPITAPAANDVATRILASGLRPCEQLPGAEMLQFKIVVAHYDGTAEPKVPNAQNCLTQLLLALRQLNDGSRKAIRLVAL